LYYRLNIIELRIPALRERMEDLPDLASALLDRIAKRRKVRHGWSLSEAALEAFQAYHWPGNIRQLENVLERATAFTDGEVLDAADFVLLLEPGNPGEQAGGARSLTLLELEREAFTRAYLANGRNKAKTARELGISERSVYNLIERHGLK